MEWNKTDLQKKKREKNKNPFFALWQGEVEK